ncbi:MAG: M20/M25/M40 family metallo-hydrolase [Deltaproteobacteria bacterium]|nr:M20/M25/M40 family metallo-hydrolase [Deltaproteobacteria bacterium]MBW2345445.1 M20/M25/M40 family metallo-hydrolase [Deltaproteobacteria bacterium]
MGLQSTSEISIYNNPSELLQNLVRYDTTNPPGNEEECIAYINDLLLRAGFETTLLAKDPNRPNLLTRLKGRGSAPPLLMYGHVDVVTTANQEWKYPPFEAKVVDGFVWGRGALDMKGGVAMMLAAIMRAKEEGMAPAGDIMLAILCDEESGSEYGARYLVDKHPEQFSGIKYAIGEFGGYTAHVGSKKFYPIQIAEKQPCRMKAIVRGPGGHGARPMRGGAMAKLAELLFRLDKHRLPVHITPVTRQMIEIFASNLPFPKGLIFRQLLNPSLTNSILKLLGDLSQYLDPLLHNTVNATIVRGGEKLNVIPSEVIVDLDGRLLPGFSPDHMLAELRKIIGDEVELELLRRAPATPAETDMGLFSTLAAVLQDADPDAIPMPLLLPGFTDGRVFANLGIQTYGFTPMKLPVGFNFFETIHAADERIPVEAMDFGANAVYELMRRYR